MGEPIKPDVVLSEVPYDPNSSSVKKMSDFFSRMVSQKEANASAQDYPHQERALEYLERMRLNRRQDNCLDDQYFHRGYRFFENVSLASFVTGQSADFISLIETVGLQNIVIDGRAQDADGKQLVEGDSPHMAVYVRDSSLEGQRYG